MSSTPFPSVRLKPKVDPRPIRHGYPWVFSDQLVLDRRTKALPPGSLAVLEDTERTALGVVAMSPASRIAARVLDLDPGAAIGRDWLAARLRSALSLRDALYDSPFYRLVHAEADGLPGVIIDRFGAAAVIQPNAAWADVMFDDIAEVLRDVTGIDTLVKNASGRTRGLEGLDDASGLVFGALDGPIAVPMNGATYLADLEGGQKTACSTTSAPTMPSPQDWPGAGQCWMSFRMSGGLPLRGWRRAPRPRLLSTGPSLHSPWRAAAPRLAVMTRGSRR